MLEVAIGVGIGVFVSLLWYCFVGMIVEMS